MKLVAMKKVIGAGFCRNWQKQIGEWIQYQLQRFDRTLPDWSPNWSISKNFVDFLGILYWIILGLFFIWVIWRLWREFSPYIVCLVS